MYANVAAYVVKGEVTLLLTTMILIMNLSRMIAQHYALMMELPFVGCRDRNEIVAMSILGTNYANENLKKRDYGINTRKQGKELKNRGLK